MMTCGLLGVPSFYAAATWYAVELAVAAQNHALRAFPAPLYSPRRINETDAFGAGGAMAALVSPTDVGA